jgi:mono/diheme cytochrome c family protein
VKVPSASLTNSVQRFSALSQRFGQASQPLSMSYPKHAEEENMKTILLACLAVTFVLGDVMDGQSQDPLLGDVQRGRALFNDSYGCGSCHGVQGIAGTVKLIPVTRTQDAFLRYLRKPTVATMPAFPDATDQQLADVYAYLKSIPTPNLQPLEKYPILNDILKTIPPALAK